MLNHPFIWIDGIIGVGKTTAVEQIGKRLNLTILPEPVNEDLLKIYYEDQKRWGFPFQIDMLNKRFAIQQKASLSIKDSKGAIIDRGLPGDRVFAKMLANAKKIHPIEWSIYEQSYDMFTQLLSPPDLLIYLDVSPEVAYKRIKNRAREAETDDLLPIEYLKNLHDEYRNMLEDFYLERHPWSDTIGIWEIDWNADWQSIDPIIEQIQTYIEVRERIYRARDHKYPKKPLLVKNLHRKTL
ncbi:MAG: deoxynucleoside kinase [Candidatus Hodarchaeales archaeon]